MLLSHPSRSNSPAKSIFTIAIEIPPVGRQAKSVLEIIKPEEKPIIEDSDSTHSVNAIQWVLVAAYMIYRHGAC